MEQLCGLRVGRGCEEGEKQQQMVGPVWLGIMFVQMCRKMCRREGEDFDLFATIDGDHVLSLSLETDPMLAENCPVAYAADTIQVTR